MNVFETFWNRPPDIPVFTTDYFWTRLWAKKSARIGVIVGALMLIFVCLYPLISPFAPDEQTAGAKLLAPCFSHPLGTDQFGRDILTRLAVGGLRSLGSAILILSLILFASIGAGIFLGMVGGLVETAAMRIIDVFLALPQLVLTLAIVGVLGVGFGNLLLAVLISWLPFYIRLARAFARSAKKEKYVSAARLSGVSWMRIAVGHIFPQVLAQMLIVATLDLGGVIVTLASLSFLGLGVQPPDAEWGAMLAESRSFFSFAPWLLLAPAGAIFLSVMAANLLGNALRDATQ